MRGRIGCDDRLREPWQIARRPGAHLDDQVLPLRKPKLA